MTDTLITDTDTTEDAGRTLPIDAHVIALDETPHWDLTGTPNLEYLLRIETVYLFDKNEQTHLCELTPSFCLYPIETRAIFHDYDAVPEEVEDAFDELCRSEAETDVKYIHCHTVEGLIESLKNEPFRYKHDVGNGNDIGYDLVPYKEQIDALIEHYQGNAPL